MTSQNFPGPPRRDAPLPPPPPVRAFNPTRVPYRGGPGIRGHWLYRVVAGSRLYKTVRPAVKVLLDCLS